MLKSNYFVILIIASLFLASCKTENKKANIEKFDWEESVTSPIGYPMEVYRGGLKRPNGKFTSLFLGLMAGESGWGSVGSGWGGGMRSLPNGIHVKWVSYAEDCVYEIDSPIDYDKIVALFKKGYDEPTNNLKRTKPFKAKYYRINVGFAPGGVVVVWVTGATRKIEIGRYQGHKIKISKNIIAKLDPPDQLMFNKEDRQRIMKDVRVVPKKIQEAHKGKPIPYGRWDTLRKRYQWKVHLELPKHIKSRETSIFYYNGEMEDLFGEFHLEQFKVEKELEWNSLRNRNVPKRVDVRWFNKKNTPSTCNIKFNEKEVFKAFEEIFKNAPKGEAQFEITVNQLETNAAVKLTGNGKEIWLPSSNVKVYK